jgi:gamma-glutamylcyclotransferase (GGCT)/AIG2-like uncharacterized protein YtfP
MTTDYLFVYGTLRRDNANDMYHLLARHAEFVGDATFQGKLYRNAVYPAAVPSDDPADAVRGEVYRLHDPDSVLPRLDEYEECGPGFAEPTEYIRTIQEVRLGNGEKRRAWIYLYNWPVKDLEPVPSGNFLDTQSGSA